MGMQSATVDADHLASQFDLLGLEIDEHVVDEVLEEMAIETDLPLETQRWLVARGMAAVSLAATVQRDEDYYLALGALGAGPAAADELDFSGVFLTNLSEDLKETFDAKSPAELSLGPDLLRRLADRDVLLGLYGGARTGPGNTTH